MSCGFKIITSHYYATDTSQKLHSRFFVNSSESRAYGSSSQLRRIERSNNLFCLVEISVVALRRTTDTKKRIYSKKVHLFGLNY